MPRYDNGLRDGRIEALKERDKELGGALDAIWDRLNCLDRKIIAHQTEHKVYGVVAKTICGAVGGGVVLGVKALLGWPREG